MGRQLNHIIPMVKRTNALLFLNKWRRRQTMGFLGRGFEPHLPPPIFFYDLSPCRIAKMLPTVSPGNGTTWILIRPPLYPADLLSHGRGEDTGWFEFNGGNSPPHECRSQYLIKCYVNVWYRTYPNGQWKRVTWSVFL